MDFPTEEELAELQEMGECIKIPKLIQNILKDY